MEEAVDPCGEAAVAADAVALDGVFGEEVLGGLRRREGREEGDQTFFVLWFDEGERGTTAEDVRHHHITDLEETDGFGEVVVVAEGVEEAGEERGACALCVWRLPIQHQNDTTGAALGLLFALCFLLCFSFFLSFSFFRRRTASTLFLRCAVGCRVVIMELERGAFTSALRSAHKSSAVLKREEDEVVDFCVSTEGSCLSDSLCGVFREERTGGGGDTHRDAFCLYFVKAVRDHHILSKISGMEDIRTLGGDKSGEDDV